MSLCRNQGYPISPSGQASNSCLDIIEEADRLSRSMSLALDDTSLCPGCDRVVPATMLVFEGFDFIVKRCPHCGAQSTGFAGRHSLKGAPDLSGHDTLLPLNAACDNLEGIDLARLRKSTQNFIFYITDSCNSGCMVCAAHGCKRQPDTTMAELKKSLAGLKKKWIYLYGGEPLVHPRAIDFVREIRASGNYPCLFTNGLALAREGAAEELKRAGIALVRVSFDGFNPDFYKRFRGGSAELALKLKAIENLGNAGVTVILDALLINGHNESEASDILAFGLSLPHVWTVSFRPLHVARGTELSRKARLDWILGSDEINSIMEKATGTAPGYSRRLFEIHSRAARLINRFVPFAAVPLPHQNQIVLQKKDGRAERLFSNGELDLLDALSRGPTPANVFRAMRNAKLRAIAGVFIRCRFNPIAIEKALSARMNVVKVYQGQIRTPYESLLSSTPAFAPVFRNGEIISYYPD